MFPLSASLCDMSPVHNCILDPTAGKDMLDDLAETDGILDTALWLCFIGSLLLLHAVMLESLCQAHVFKMLMLTILPVSLHMSDVQKATRLLFTYSTSNIRKHELQAVGSHLRSSTSPMPRMLMRLRACCGTSTAAMPGPSCADI